MPAAGSFFMIIPDKDNHTYKVYWQSGDNDSPALLGEFRSKQEARDFELKQTGFTGSVHEEEKYDNISFDRLLDSFLDEKRVRVRTSTFIGYDLIAERFIRPCFRNRKINEITPADIRGWQNGMLKLDYSQLYLHRVDSVMSAVFKYGVRFFGLKNNPCDHVGTIGESVPKSVNFWTIDEFARFMTAVTGKRNRLMFNLLYWTGLRLGELLALTPDDVDLENGMIRVTKTYRRYHGQDIISPPKTRKSRRVVYINSSLTEEIRDYINTEYHSLNPEGIGHRLFPVGFDSVRDTLTRAARKAGVKRIKIHDLRHSHASLLINMNVTPLLVSERLGHVKVETTLNTYSHLYPDEQKKIADSLEKIFR